ncbi:hypothetical protein VTL71DRAFT_2732 [Oculimacula yallundae]|uniref:Uncharacterized protein n=1 Tax=Oculimacula yallundae TaxID=86028 RepID=A0ABR4C9P1_9HELO
MRPQEEAKMPAKKTPTKEGRPANSRPAPSSFEPTDGGDETPTPSKKKRTIAEIVESATAKVSPDKVAKPASMVPFRHKWMKKTNSKGVPFAEIEMTSDSANTYEDGSSKTPKSAKGKSRAVGLPPAMSAFGTPVTPRKDEDSDSEDEYDESQGVKEEAYMDAEGKIGKFGPRAMNTIEKARRKLKTEEGVTDPNGRSVGRKLVMWHRPRMMEKLILHTQYECHKKGIQIPWDDVVHRLSPGSSGPSATQMLNKLRDVLVTEGHMIPPVLGKSGAPVDPTLRGYIRDMEADIPTTTKAVRWSDNVRDLKESLVVPGLIRGSGKYRKTPKSDRVTVPSDYDNLGPGQRRDRKPAEVTQWAAEQRALKGSARKVKTEERSTRIGSARKRANKDSQDDSDSEVDPAELDSDEDYDPERKKSSNRRRKISEDWSSQNPYTSPTPKSRKKFSKYAIPSESEDDEKKDKNSLVVKLRIPSGGLEDFESGVSGKKPKNVGYFEPPKRLFKEELMKSSKQIRSTGGADHGVKRDIDDRVKESSSYQGLELHGTLGSYMQALKDGKDPSLNRHGFKDAKSIYNKCTENPDAESLLIPEEAEALSVHREALATGQLPVESIEGNDADRYAGFNRQAGGNNEDAPFDFDDQAHGYGNTHSAMQYQQHPSQSFSGSSFHPNSFNSQSTSFGSQFHDNYQTGNYAENNYEVRGGGGFTEMEGMVPSSDFDIPGQNQAHSMAGSRMVPPGQRVIYEDSPEPSSNGNEDELQAEREESPAPWMATAVRNPFDDPPTENRPDGDYYMHDVHHEQQSNDGDHESVGGFANY